MEASALRRTTRRVKQLWSGRLRGGEALRHLIIAIFYLTSIVIFFRLLIIEMVVVKIWVQYLKLPNYVPTRTYIKKLKLTRY